MPDLWPLVSIKLPESGPLVRQFGQGSGAHRTFVVLGNPAILENGSESPPRRPKTL